MELMNKNVRALVVSTQDNWQTCCVTEYTDDDVWHCGINIITSVSDALETARKNKLNIIFEEMLREEGL